MHCRVRRSTNTHQISSQHSGPAAARCLGHAALSHGSGLMAFLAPSLQQRWLLASNTPHTKT